MDLTTAMYGKSYMAFATYFKYKYKCAFGEFCIFAH